MTEKNTTKKTAASNVIPFKSRTQDLVTTALMIALTYVATWLINIRLPFVGSGGLIHLGNVPLFIAAILFGRRTGALAGGIGMGLFDLLSGWTAWAPFTLIIVGFMGFVVGLFAEKRPIRNVHLNDTVSMILALLIKIVGYYFAEVILYGNWITPLGSIPGNVLQVVTAAVIVLAVLPVLRRVTRRAYAVAV
ncbi:ECF transporter S component [Bilifractor sp. HCP3S3_D3]|uniref:ECF transporter S component n=1 Tax=unclassified Bilifractor TaxID=2815795 RepID=UPI002A885A34|nr:ECF transporter S component [Bilifractor sp.]